MKIKAYAKINLALNVIGKRDDGYHDLDMIMVPINLYDKLTFTFNDQDILIFNGKRIKNYENNTIYRSIVLLREAFKFKEHFLVKVEKRIPMQAGLAGGSADGAATLKAVNQMCNLGLDEEQLINFGKQIGADVPFTLVARPCRVKGIGEKLEDLNLTEDLEVLLVKPIEGVSTKDAFGKLNYDTCVHPDIDLITQRINANEPYEDLLDNTLEAVAIELVPPIKVIEDELKACGLKKVLMSGSGSSVFALGTHDDLVKAWELMKKNKHFVKLTHIISGSAYRE